MFDQNTLYFAGYLVLLFAVSVLVGRIASPIFIRLVGFLTSKTKSTLDDRIFTAIKAPVESFFFLIVFYFLIHAFLELAAAAAFVEQYIYAILIVIATFMLSEASGAAIRWYYEEGHKSSRIAGVDLSLLPLVRKITKLAIYMVGLTLALSATGFDVTGLLAITSIAGLILGFASQETLANLFAGIALQMDRPYHYGDFIRLPGDEIAIVRKIGMRSTKLEDMQHNVITISNSEFAKMRVTNLSLPDDESIVPVSAELPHGADLHALRAMVERALTSEKPKGLLFDRGYGLSIDMVKPATVAFTFTFRVKGYQHAASISGLVNKCILDFARNGSAAASSSTSSSKNSRRRKK